MEKGRNLNAHDGWETIINENANRKSYARSSYIRFERERKMKQLWLRACGIVVLGLTFLILGVTGAVSDWLATAVCVTAIAAGSFTFGRYVEVKKG